MAHLTRSVKKSMAIKKVESSMVWAFDYDPKTQVLEVAFKRTGVFRYEGVPRSEYRRMMRADSIDQAHGVRPSPRGQAETCNNSAKLDVHVASFGLTPLPRPIAAPI